MKKDTRRQDRAKKLLSVSKGSSAGDSKIKMGKSTGLSGAMPKAAPVSGASPKNRLDKRPRYASGGGVDGDDMPKKKGSPKNQINIVIAGKGDQPAPPMAAPMMPPPSPPMAPPGLPPQGMKPPGAMKRGGGVTEYPIDAGSGGGKGRLEKAAAAKHTDNSGKKKR